MVQYSVGESSTPPTCPSLAFTFLAKPRSLDKNALWLTTRVPLSLRRRPARATARAAPMAPPQDGCDPPSTRAVTNADKSTLVAPFPRVHLVGTVLRHAPELAPPVAHTGPAGPPLSPCRQGPKADLDRKSGGGILPLPDALTLTVLVVGASLPSEQHGERAKEVPPPPP